MRRSSLPMLFLFQALLAVILAPHATAQTDSSALRTAVALPGVRAHQSALQAIADANGGTRASTTPGYVASANYVAGLLSAAGYAVTLEPFSYGFYQERVPSEFEQVAPTPTTYPPNVFTGFFTAFFSGSGDITATVEGVDLSLPPGPTPNSSTSGCEAPDFTGFTAGNIALIQRGTCEFGVKAQLAEAAGASAVVIFNEGQTGRTSAFSGTLGAPGTTIPVVLTSFAIGSDLFSSSGTARVFVDAISELRTSNNVIADAPGGSDDRLVIAGAQLDSVTAGPGIQNNGSGTAALLEIALQIAELGLETEHRLRFAWWGGAAESRGEDVRAHIASLTPAEVAAALYLNFQMLGSPNYVRFVHDGDGSDFPNADFPATPPAGSAEIEGVFLDYFAARGLASSPDSAGNIARANFAGVGIPVGGLFGGASGLKTPGEAAIYGGTAGVAYDPCFNSACDTFDNISLQALDELTDAAAHAILQFAGVVVQDPPIPVELESFEVTRLQRR